MGFLKFLKKGKKEDSLDKMDLPPAPPPLGDFDENMPDFPEFDESKYSPMDEDSQKLEFPEIAHPDIGTESGSADMGQERNTQDFPKDFPTFPKIDESQMPPIEPIRVPPAAILPPSPLQKQQAPYMQENEENPGQSDSDKHGEYQKSAPKSLEHEKKILRQSMNVKEVYVRIDKFKATLGSISTIRSDLRKSEEALLKLETIKSSKDKSLDKAKSSMEDLQKKLIFIDKTLFKGD